MHSGADPEGCGKDASERDERPEQREIEKHRDLPDNGRDSGEAILQKTLVGELMTENRPMIAIQTATWMGSS